MWIYSWGPEKICHFFTKSLPQSWRVSTWGSSVNMHVVPDPGKMKMLMKNGHTLSALSVCWTSVRIARKEGKEISLLPQAIPYHVCPWAHGRQNYFDQSGPWFHNCRLMDHSQVPFSRKQCGQGPLSPSFWSMKCFQEQVKHCGVSRPHFVFTAFRSSWGILVSSKTRLVFKNLISSLIICKRILFKELLMWLNRSSIIRYSHQVGGCFF